MTVKKDINATSPVHILLDPTCSVEDANRIAKSQGITKVHWLSQRDSRLGWIGVQDQLSFPSLDTARRNWQAAQPIQLPGLVKDAIPAHSQEIAQAESLMHAVLDGADCAEILQQQPYAERLAPCFELLSSTYDEGDPQEIVKLEFDARQDGDIIAENLWVKLSWLSYAEEDVSLRFRFSFGMENFEDVAADPRRQAYAAALTEAIFPESAIISANDRLRNFLCELLNAKDLMYVERIVYFNAPEGGAQFHHDVERGHLGVVFAQLSGHTAWFALSTEQLLDVLLDFLSAPDAADKMAKIIESKRIRSSLIKLADDRAALAEYLSRGDYDPLEQLINRTPAFTRSLIERGHAYILNPGDILLLPQYDAARCSWHAVYCLDETPGEALSFAIRHAAT